MVQMIILAEKYFLMMDPSGLTVLTYEGRTVSSPKFNGLRPEFLNKHTVALCNDCVAVLDRSDSKTVRVFDTVTGRQMTSGLTHKVGSPSAPAVAQAAPRSHSFSLLIC